ncbi:MAG: hypothetical protein Q8941_24135 [Bacteroidota bacterium]|nr:hypothetical protein [Bacteroidota bacterium]
MKKILLISFVLISVMGLSTRSNAQVRIGVNINIGAQPDWGPAGYDGAEYYYLPDIECYYNVPQRQFVYLANGRWTFSASLPSCYAGYDLYSGYKVVVNRPYAYNYFNTDRVQYAHYKNYYGRQECRGNHYYERSYDRRDHDYDRHDRDYDRHDRDYDRHDRDYDHDNGWHGNGRKNGYWKHRGRHDD